MLYSEIYGTAATQMIHYLTKKHTKTNRIILIKQDTMKSLQTGGLYL